MNRLHHDWIPHPWLIRSILASIMHDWLPYFLLGLGLVNWEKSLLVSQFFVSTPHDILMLDRSGQCVLMKIARTSPLGNRVINSWCPLPKVSLVCISSIVIHCFKLLFLCSSCKWLFFHNILLYLMVELNDFFGHCPLLRLSFLLPHECFPCCTQIRESVVD